MLTINSNLLQNVLPDQFKCVHMKALCCYCIDRVPLERLKLHSQYSYWSREMIEAHAA